MAGAKMIRVKMTNGMTKHFRFNSLGKLTDGINLTDRINVTDDYITSLSMRRPCYSPPSPAIGLWSRICQSLDMTTLAEWSTDPREGRFLWWADDQDFRTQKYTTWLMDRGERAAIQNIFLLLG